MEFKPFKQHLQKAFDALLVNQTHLYRTNVEADKLWDAYLNSFQNPAERQSFNCSCCRSFIKHYGGLVALVNGEMVTIWDFDGGEYFNPGVQAMRSLVKAASIENVFFTKFAQLGVDSNPAPAKSGEGTVTWNHMAYKLPNQFITRDSRSIEALMGQYRDNRNVFKRSLEEISSEALEIVLELIAQGSLYRGEEFKGALKEFLKYKQAYADCSNKENYCWQFAVTLPTAIAKIKNTAIGTLLTDVSGDRELDQAVSAFERIMAPANYKRPTAVVTKSMITAAEKEITELGLLPSLGRRLAAAEDIKINNLLFVDRDAKKASDVFGEMKEDTLVNPRLFSKVEEIGIDDFLTKVLPGAEGIEVLVENHHMGNFVTVVTAKDPEAPGLFKWPNPFSWNYTNGVTDSIKEKVKAAGGKVDGVLRVSLSWFNYDDLDLHVIEPGGHRIWFNDKNSSTGGHLDVDMNAGSGQTRSAVENITWPDERRMKEGKYTVIVNNYSKRENIDAGFSVELECNGEQFHFDHNQSPGSSQNILVAEFNWTKKDGLVISTAIKSTTVSKDKWNVSTNKFQKVSMVMNSPNHWDGKHVGNKHVFFVLDGAKTDEPVRGFYNEFLKDDLTQNHKRVFEVLAGRLKVEPADKELSGIGFSSTQTNSLICTVKGKTQRTLKVNF